MPHPTPSMYTQMVDPSAGMLLGNGVNTHPRRYELPEIIAPCAGKSIVPNGFVAFALSP